MLHRLASRSLDDVIQSYVAVKSAWPKQQFLGDVGAKGATLGVGQCGCCALEHVELRRRQMSVMQSRHRCAPVLFAQRAWARAYNRSSLLFSPWLSTTPHNR